jgi:soluble lytic murein transglycosylase-like protein
VGLDPALVFGLIRQESRFMRRALGRRRQRPDAGDAGHRRWTARKIGLALPPGA